MRRAVLVLATVCLLGVPTVLAFRSGGFFPEPRLIAALVIWALMLVAPLGVPRRRAGRVALGGLVLMTAFSAASIAWAPLGGPAAASAQRLLLYTGAFVLAVGVLRASPLARRAVEPALAAGAVVVLAYGLAGRLLPTLITLAQSRSAGGRLEQPITYWNAEGALAAVGLILCTRLAGDRTRPRWMRALAAAGVVPLGAAVYVSFSRGAIAVTLLGLVALAAMLPVRAQLRACGVALISAVLAAVACAPFAAVTALEGTPSARATPGLVVLVLLLVLAVVAAGVTLLLTRREDATAGEAPSWGRRLGPVAAVAVAVAAIGLVGGGLAERPTQAELSRGAQAGRLTTVSSNRYEYWRVALKTFAANPVIGAGAGSFRVAWLQERRIDETVRDAHSIEFEMAAELGLVGLLALVLLVVGVVASGRRALRTHPEAAAGLAAATLAWFPHASIDWLWQLPAVSLPAIVLAAGLVALADAPEG